MGIAIPCVNLRVLHDASVAITTTEALSGAKVALLDLYLNLNLSIHISKAFSVTNLFLDRLILY